LLKTGRRCRPRLDRRRFGWLLANRSRFAVKASERPLQRIDAGLSKKLSGGMRATSSADKLPTPVDFAENARRFPLKPQN
jgi:hypothetical protein